MELDFVIENNRDATICGVDSSIVGELVIPESVVKDDTTYIVTTFELMNDCNAKRLVIPSGVRDLYIEDNKTIEELILLGDLTSCLCCQCSALQKVHIFGTATRIPSNSFQNNYKLREFIVDNGTIDEIGCNAFANCHSLEVIRANGTSQIINFQQNKFCPSAFSGCLKFKDFGTDCILHDGILISKDYKTLYTIVGKDIDDGVYVIPATINEIYHGNKYIGIVKLDLSNTRIPVIENGAFEDCINLEEVILPTCHHELGIRVFANCINLHKLDNLSFVTKIGRGAFKNTGITYFQIPKLVSEIPAFAFDNCRYLKELDIHTGVKSIYSSAFEGCNNIKKVSISIGYQKYLSEFFNCWENIEFKYYTSVKANGHRPKMTGYFTNGSLRCPYCGTNDVRTFCDGTAECNKCGGEYTYWRL